MGGGLRQALADPPSERYVQRKPDVTDQVLESLSTQLDSLSIADIERMLEAEQSERVERLLVEKILSKMEKEKTADLVTRFCKKKQKEVFQARIVRILTERKDFSIERMVFLFEGTESEKIDGLIKESILLRCRAEPTEKVRSYISMMPKEFKEDPSVLAELIYRDDYPLETVVDRIQDREMGEDLLYHVKECFGIRMKKMATPDLVEIFSEVEGRNKELVRAMVCRALVDRDDVTAEQMMGLIAEVEFTVAINESDAVLIRRNKWLLEDREFIHNLLRRPDMSVELKIRLTTWTQ